MKRHRAALRFVGGGWPRWLRGAVGLCLGCASTDDQASSPRCLGRTAEPLVGGASEETYLGLAPSQTRAIVELVDGSGTTDASCTGVAVSRSWVLSAAHCARIPELSVRLQGEETPEELVSVARVEGSSAGDLALLELDFSQGDLLDRGVTPALTAPASLELRVGDAVELAGFGRSESGVGSGLRFLVETVVAVDRTSVIVDGFGVTGACDGDSGGPLLTRAGDGSLFVAGILSAGDPSCRGRDRYLRLDVVSDWVEATAGSQRASGLECGAIGDEGRCLGGAALWCEAGLLQTSACTANGQACGWDADRAGFRCVNPLLDPCSGVDRVGTCRESSAVTCVAGTLAIAPCNGCRSCRVDGRTGAPYCAP